MSEINHVGPPPPPPPPPIIPVSVKNAFDATKQIQQLFADLNGIDPTKVAEANAALKKILPGLKTELSKIPAYLGDFSKSQQYFSSIEKKLQSGPLEGDDLSTFEENVTQLSAQLNKILWRL